MRIFSQNTVTYSMLKLILVVGFLFFAFAFVFLLKRAKAGKSILIVDDKGITDHSSAVAFGFIPWADVKQVYLTSIMGNQLIELELNNEEQYIQRLSRLQQFAFFANRKLGRQAVCITLNTTNVSPQSIYTQIQQKLQAAKS